MLTRSSAFAALVNLGYISDIIIIITVITIHAKNSSISCTELKLVQFWLIFAYIWLPWQLPWLP